MDAVGDLLREKGVPGLGVNAVARRAGVDKVLIYRYYDGLDGLVGHWARTQDFWPTSSEVLGPDEELLREPDHARLARVLLERYVAALRRRPVTLQLLAWEMAADHPLLAVLEEVREQWAVELQARLAPLELPQSAFTLMNLHIAGAHYLLVRSRRIAVFGATRVGDDADWALIYDAVETSFRGLLSPSS